ncbi:MAG: hypothetical protein AAB881_01675 [Patescibacteria group bacterium]
MRQFFAIIFIIGFLLAAVPLLMLTNMRMTILSADKVKTLLFDSNVYEFMGAGLRETIVSEANTGVENGQFMEILNESLDTETLRKVTEDSVDQIFALAKNPNAEPKITITTSQLEERIREVIKEKDYGSDIKLLNESGEVTSTLGSTPFGGDQVYSINQFPVAGALVRFTQGLLISGISTIVLLLIIFLVSSGSMGARFKWLGGTFLVLGIAMLGLAYANIYLLPGQFGNIVNRFELRDPRFIAGATKFVTNLTATQKIPLIVETIASLVLGILLIIIGSTFKQEKIEIAPPKKVQQTA